MSQHHVVVGAGPVGRHVASLLAERGDRVTVVTRSGRDTGLPGVSHVASDASDPAALGRVVDGAAVLYNCANPGDYTQWERVWPPLATSLLTTAERTGAVYAITGNLYPYGPVTGPMHPGLPDAATDHKGVLRARLWSEARAAHEAGRVRAVEVRASDYVGPGIGENGHITRVLPAALRGRSVSMLGRTDVPHTFTDVLDVARTLVAAADDQGSHGRTWTVPSNAPRSQRQALTEVLAAAGKPPVTVRRLPAGMLRVLGVASPMMREIADMAYQWTAPYVVDDSASRRRFGIEPTPWDEVCRRTVAGATAEHVRPAGGRRVRHGREARYRPAPRLPPVGRSPQMTRSRVNCPVASRVVAPPSAGIRQRPGVRVSASTNRSPAVSAARGTARSSPPAGCRSSRCRWPSPRRPRAAGG